MDFAIKKALQQIPENEIEIRRPTERVKGALKKYYETGYCCGYQTILCLMKKKLEEGNKKFSGMMQKRPWAEYSGVSVSGQITLQDFFSFCWLRERVKQKKRKEEESIDKEGK